MNIRDLRYLVTLAELRHFGQAAENCFVSQPTLSAQLKKLEDELGVCLIERSKKSVRVTPVGECIVQEARLILQHIAKIKNMALNAQDPFAGSFRLGIIPTLGPYLLPYILSPIKKSLPRLELIVYESKTAEVLNQLRQGILDAVILALPVKSEGLAVLPLFREPFYLALPKGHVLASKKKLTMKDIQRETLLLLEEGHCLREQALEACKFSASNALNGFSATSLETLRQIVSLGAGVTLLPALAVKSSQIEKNIVIKPIDGLTPSREVGMLWRESAVNEVCCRCMAEIIQEQVQHCAELQIKRKLKLLSKPLG